MAPHSSGPYVSPLRALTTQIATTPTAELPQRISHLISAVQGSAQALSASESNAASRDASDAAVVVHKYRTQLSSLLQGRSPEGRWTAVVLVKTTIEVCGWEALKGCDVWVRGMLVVLGVCWVSFSPSMSLDAILWASKSHLFIT